MVAASNPFFTQACPVLGKAVAADEGKAQPAVARRAFGQFLKCFLGAQCHGVILRSHHIDPTLLRGGKAQPGTDGVVGARFGPAVPS